MNSLSHYWDLILVLTHKEIKVRYKNNVLGYLWSIANPLALAGVFYVAFKVFMRIRVEDYPVFLITGLFPWQWFSNSVSVSVTVFLGNASIIKKINFPRNVVPLSIVLQDMIHFVLSIPVIVLFLAIYHKSPSAAWLWGVPALLAIQLALTYGVCLFLSSVNLFFRDMEKLTNLFLVLLFYFTPVLYSVDMIPARYQPWVNLNPVAPLMINWRNCLLYGYVDPAALGVGALWAAGLLLLGYAVYRKLSWKFAEVL